MKGSPFAKVRLPYVRECLSDLLDSCLLLFLSGFSNDE